MTPNEAMLAVFDAWERRDVEALAGLFTDDARYEDPLRPSTVVGRDAITDEYRPSLEGLAECEITVHHSVEDGDLAFCEAYFAAELQDGGRLDFPFAAMIEMRDGKIARIGEYFDTKPLTP
jgi:ketosteroid isomerase-like protein